MRSPQDQGRSLIGRLAERIVKALVKRPFISLAVILGLTVGLALWAARIKVRGDLEDLFPEDAAVVQRAREARRILGSKTELQVLVGSPDQLVNRAVASEIAVYLESRDDIDRVEFRRDISFFEKNALLFLPTEDLEELEDKVTKAIQKAVKEDLGLDDFELDDEEPAAPAPAPDTADDEELRLPTVEEVKKEHDLEGFSEYFESPDGQVIAVKAFPRFKPSDAEKTEAMNVALLDRIREIVVAHPTPAGGEITVTLEGDYTDLTRAKDQIVRDAGSSLIWAVLLIVLTAIVYFRRLRVMLTVLIPLACGLVWSLAFARAFVGYLNLVTSVLLAILLGVGIDFLVHAIARVDEHHTRDTPLSEAIPNGMGSIGRALWDAAITTAVTFFALIIFEFRGFSQFGLISGFGVLFALLAVYLVYPPMAMALDRLWRAPHRRAWGGGRASAEALSRPRRRAGLALVGGFVSVSLVAVFLVPQIHYEADMSKLRAKVSEDASALKRKYRKDVESRNASPAIVITDDLADTERLYRHVSAHQDDYPALTDVVSIFTFVPERQVEKLAIVREIARKIDNKYNALEGKAKDDADELRRYLDPAAFGPGDLPAWVLDKFTDTEGGFGRYVLLYARGPKANAKVVIDIQQQIGDLTVPAQGELPPKTYVSTASFYINAAVYDVVKDEGPKAAGLGLGIVILLVLLDFRRIRPTLMVLAPLVSGFLIFLGVLALADIPINVFNIVVFPQVFGIGVDTGIHLVCRWQEEAHLPAGAFWRSFMKTARASAICSLTTSMGFGSLIACENEGLRSIGWVAVIGIASLFVTNLLMIIGFVLVDRHRSARSVAAVAEVR